MSGRSLIASALVLLVLIWGTTWAAIRISLEGIPPLTGVALRFAVAGLVLLALFPVLHVRLRPERRVVALWAINAVFSFAFSYGIVYWAEQYVPSGVTSVLWATFPLWVALLAHLWLPGERLTLRSLGGILAGFGGVAVIFSEDLSRLVAATPAGGAGPPIALAAGVLLLSPLSAAIANVAVKRWGEGVHPLSLTAVPMLLAALLMGVAAAKVEGFADLHLAARPVAAWLYLSIVGSAVTFTVYFWLLSHLPATRLSLITYGIPVVAVLVGTVFLDEPLTARILAGSVLVVIGVAVAARG
jgi:drug/metabolite transporter (DMT)-like permease